MKKKFFLIIISLLFISAFSVFIFIKINSTCPSNNKDVVVIEYKVKKGASAKFVAKELKEKKIILNENLFYIFARYPKIASFFTNKSASIFKIQKGYYELNSAMNIVQVFEELSSGKEKTVTVSIPEGLTITKIAERLRESGIKNIDNFEQIALHQGKSIFKKHNLKLNSDSVEGFLYPDTYIIPIEYNSEQIIDLMIDNLLNKIKGNNKINGIQELSAKEFYQIIILASIVEREYRVKEEACSIAGVFKNRLSINMPLQSCATVEYIITEILHKPHPKIIYYEDLEIKNPYNTYKNTGLPPGPISNPGITSIIAATRPEESDYLFFTLTDSSAGRHTFSKDFNSHIKATDVFRTKGR